MCYVYAIQSQVDQRIYVGMTVDLENRLNEHNKEKTKSTEHFIPWKIIYFDRCNSRTEARAREKYWKAGSGKEKLKKLVP